MLLMAGNATEPMLPTPMAANAQALLGANARATSLVKEAHKPTKPTALFTSSNDNMTSRHCSNNHSVCSACLITDYIGKAARSIAGARNLDWSGLATSGKGEGTGKGRGHEEGRGGDREVRGTRKGAGEGTRKGRGQGS